MEKKIILYQDIYLIKHAPKSYIDDYNVEFRGEDILLDANGFTASFQLLQ